MGKLYVRRTGSRYKQEDAGITCSVCGFKCKTKKEWKDHYSAAADHDQRRLK